MFHYLPTKGVPSPCLKVVIWTAGMTAPMVAMLEESRAAGTCSQASDGTVQNGKEDNRSAF